MTKKETLFDKVYKDYKDHQTKTPAKLPKRYRHIAKQNYYGTSKFKKHYAQNIADMRELGRKMKDWL